MILIVFATFTEAQSSLQALEAKPRTQEGLFAFDDGYIVLSGLGVVNAATAVARYGLDASEIWNAGLAGSLRSDWEVGDLLSIGSVTKNLCLPDDTSVHAKGVAGETFDEIVVGEGRARLVSSDFPVYAQTERERLGLVADVVDMEGYGIAAAARALNKPCKIWKMVSDNADAGGHRSLQANRDALGRGVSELLVSRFDAAL